MATTNNPPPLPERFCWSKVGTESGESLDRILARKEFERRANGGYFLWGVGNSVLTAVEGLLRVERRPQIIFSHIKSKPKAADVCPSVIYLWQGAEIADGTPWELPLYSLVTSRGNTEARGHKLAHYALVCYSRDSLLDGVTWKNAIDASTLANLQTGRPLGASQVTSVVARIGKNRDTHLRGKYSIDILADMAAPGQVRLTDPISIHHSLANAIENAIARRDYDAWISLVREMRSTHRTADSAKKLLRGQSDFFLGQTRPNPDI